MKKRPIFLFLIGTLLIGVIALFVIIKPLATPGSLVAVVQYEGGDPVDLDSSIVKIEVYGNGTIIRRTFGGGILKEKILAEKVALLQETIDEIQNDRSSLVLWEKAGACMSDLDGVDSYYTFYSTSGDAFVLSDCAKNGVNSGMYRTFSSTEESPHPLLGYLLRILD